jgi:hypothetical protein
MVANALWTFAMAYNVYLTFFRKYDAHQLRLLEWKYILFCYGIPFIPAFILFFVRSESRGKAYGSAVVCVSHTILLLVIWFRLTLLVVVLDTHRMGLSAYGRRLRTYLAHDYRNLRDLHIRGESDASMASRAVEVYPKSPK